MKRFVHKKITALMLALLTLFSTTCSSYAASDMLANAEEFSSGLQSCHLDYDWFIKGDNTVYNSEMARLALVGGVTATYSSSSTILSDMGFEDVLRIDVNSETSAYNVANGTNYDPDDTNRIIMAHHSVTSNGTEYEIIFLAARGSVTTQDWLSNVDVGADETTEYENVTGIHPEWTDPIMHKGFNVTANRIKEKADAYVNEYVSETAEKIIFITGHSRGGALANVLGTFYEDDPVYKSFTYSFASPGTTTADAGTCAEYKTIFNMVNLDDLVTLMPLPDWGFRRYGTDMSYSVEDLADEYLSFFGSEYVSCGASELDLALKNVAENREDLYTIDTTNDDNYAYYTWVYGASARDRQVAELEQRFTEEGLMGYVEIVTKETGGYGVFKTYEIGYYYAPGFVLELVGQLMDMLSGEDMDMMDLVSFLGKHKMADAVYNSIIQLLPAICSGGLVGSDGSHMTRGYYLIACMDFGYTNEQFYPTQTGSAYSDGLLGICLGTVVIIAAVSTVLSKKAKNKKTPKAA